MTEPAYDYLIVGAGPAGCVLANRLSANANVKVALIEAGPENNHRRAIVKMPLAMVTFMAPALKFLGGHKFVDWFESEPEPGLQGRRMAMPRGLGTGGSSNINGQIFIRGQREDFDGWESTGCEGWGYEGVLPYFKKLETFTGPAVDAPYHGNAGPLTISPPRSINPLTKVFLQAAGQAGLKPNPDFNGRRQEGVGLYAYTHKHGQRVTAEGAYLEPVRQRANLSIIPNHRALKLILEGKNVKGVALRGPSGETQIRAREVILCAGAFVSPHLLQLSGIGDAQALKKAGIMPAHHLPGVGQNLQDHLDITVSYKAKSTAPYGISWRALPRNMLHVLDWIFRKRGLFASTTCESGAFVITAPEHKRPDIQLFFCSGVANTQNAKGFTGHGFLVHACELRPRSIGHVMARSPDPMEKPSIIYNFFRSESTFASLREGFRLIRRIVAQPAFAAHFGAELEPGPEVESDGAIDAFIRQTVGTLFHPVGTCKMGRDEMAVVDPATLRVHGMKGLRVVDASIMPLLVSANTVAATYMLAEKSADLIAAADSRTA